MKISALNRPKLMRIVAAAFALALLALAAIHHDGLDAKQAREYSDRVWVWRDNNNSGQYARVNTQTHEIDAVQNAEAPTAIAQAGSRALLFTAGGTRAWGLDGADPLNVAADHSTDAASGAQMPAQTTEVMTAGAWVLALTAEGKAYLADIAGGESAESQLADAVEINSAAEVAGAVFVAAAIAENGEAALYDAAGNRILRYRGVTKKIIASAALPESVKNQTEYQLSFSGKDWALLAGSDRLWFNGAKHPLEIPGGNARLAAARARAEPIYIASHAGLWEIADKQLQLVSRATGEAAKPVSIGGISYAAWSSENTVTLWRSSSPDETLQLPMQKSEIAPAALRFESSGGTGLLVDTAAGRIWQLPEGKSIPLAQWYQNSSSEQDRGEVLVADAPDPQPPEAVPDRFGARAGSTVSLPILLNDHDPNQQDLLRVAELESIPAELGDIELDAQKQHILLHTKPGAAGSFQFKYRLSDGALTSNMAAVTIDIHGASEQSAPVWCGVSECRRALPAPSVEPGGSSLYDFFEGWVDPDGDALAVTDVKPVNSADPIKTVVTTEGRVAVQHTAPERPGNYEFEVFVSDSRGAVGSVLLAMNVKSGAQLEFTPGFERVPADTAVEFDPLAAVTGGSGVYRLENIASADARVEPNYAAGKAKITVGSASAATVSVQVIDEVSGQRVTGALIFEAGDSKDFALPPLRAYVRANSDVTVDLVGAIRGASDPLVVSDALPRPVAGAYLYADLISGSQLRITGAAGSRPDSGPDSAAHLGEIAFTVRSGEIAKTGQVSVFAVPASAPVQAVAMLDRAFVRAGDVVDIDVLANDTVSPGSQLMLSPQLAAPEMPGSLAFVSGSILRYAAPREPGVYSLSYTASAAEDPDVIVSAQVRVTVMPADQNSEPKVDPVTVRLARNSTAVFRLPPPRTDSDGDTVWLAGVSGEQSEVTAELTRDGIKIVSRETTRPGVYELQYSVRDSRGGVSSAPLRVVVSADNAGAPVAYSDYLRIPPGAHEAELYPLANDLDPAGGQLQLISVTPQLPGGAKNTDYEKLARQVESGSLSEGTIVLKNSAEIIPATYRYEVKSAASGGISEGLITVQISSRYQPQALTVNDTVLQAHERSELSGAGIDVVTERVSWPGGSVSDLELSLQDTHKKDYRVVGKKIVGAYKPGGDRVVFRLTGEDKTGERLTSYGFLIVPPLAELNLALRSNLQPLEVTEGGEISAPLRSVIAISEADQIEQKTSKLKTFRPGSSCEIKDSAIMYKAGAGSDIWQDSCILEVRLTGQTKYTQLAIPVKIHPETALLRLRDFVGTLTPGQTQEINLTELVEWLGVRAGNTAALKFTATGDSGDLSARIQGQKLKIELAATAVPGIQYALQIRSQDQSAQVTIKSGRVSSPNPHGAVLQLSCKTSSECAAVGVGVPGEYDPFAGAHRGGLRLVSVNNGSCAAVGNFRVAGERIVFEPLHNTAGLRCAGSFIVADAQGRTGPGRIELDLRGVPRAPAHLRQTGYTENSVTFAVTLSPERAYPAVTAVSVASDSGLHSNCKRQTELVYECHFSGLKAGEKHSFYAAAQNSVGVSEKSLTVSGWALKTPVTPDFELRQLAADTVAGVVQLTVKGDGATGGYELSINAADPGKYVGSEQRIELSLPQGEHSLALRAVSSDLPPPGLSLEQVATVTKHITVTVAPSAVQVTRLNSTDAQKAVVKVSAEGGGDMSYGVAYSGSCVADQKDTELAVAGLAGSVVTITACVKNKWGSAVSDPQQIVIGEIAAPTGLTYQIGELAGVAGSARKFRADVLSPPQPKNPEDIEYIINDEIKTEFKLEPGEHAPVISAVRRVAGYRSDPARVTARGAGVGAAPVLIEVSPNLQSVSEPAELAQHLVTAKTGGAQLSFGKNADGFVTITVAGFEKSVVTDVRVR